MKKCTKCNKNLPETDFHKCKIGENGLRSWCKECVKQWAYVNKKELKEYKKQWNVRNNERQRKLKSDKYWDGRSPYIPKTEEERKAYKHHWYEINKKDCIARAKVSRAKRRDRIYQNGGSFTKDEWLDLCERFDNQCVCCGNQGDLSVDHIVPISKGGTNYIWNIQPLCLMCNLKKGTKTVNYIDLYLVDN